MKDSDLTEIYNAIEQEYVDRGYRLEQVEYAVNEDKTKVRAAWENWQSITPESGEQTNILTQIQQSIQSSKVNGAWLKGLPEDTLPLALKFEAMSLMLYASVTRGSGGTGEHSRQINHLAAGYATLATKESAISRRNAS